MKTDAALTPFLGLLQRDVADRPAATVSLAAELAARMAASAQGVAPDPDGPIKDEVDV